MIVLNPLVSVVLDSPLIAHALTGQCAGDCALCGCAPERSANHTCCCWLNKPQLRYDEDQNRSTCCNKKPSDEKKSKTIISSRPCGSGKIAALALMEQGDIFPYDFTAQIPVTLESKLTGLNPHCQTDWLGEPPEHPPKISRWI